MTKQKATTTRYISKYKDLKIVKKSSNFREVDGRIIDVPGESIRFSKGTFETDDPAIIEFLDNRPEFGESFIKIDNNIDKLAKRDEYLESLEEREKRIQEKERELGIKEAKKNAHGEGGSVTKEEDYSKLSLRNSREELDEAATELNIDNPEKLENKQKVLDKINEVLEDKKEKPAYE